MGKKRNTIVVSGMIGALGVMGVTQVPDVQAAMQHFEQFDQANNQQVGNTDPVHQSLQKLMGVSQNQPQAKTKPVKTKQDATNVKYVAAKKDNAKQQAVRAAKTASSEATVDMVDEQSTQAIATSASQVATVAMPAASETAAVSLTQTVEDTHAQSNLSEATDVASQTATSQVTTSETTVDESNMSQSVTSQVTSEVDQSQVDENSLTTEGQANQQPVVEGTDNAMTDATDTVVSNGTATNSGELVAQAYQQATGRVIPVNTTEQEAYFSTTDLNGQPVAEVAQPGDVVFWGDHGTSYQTGVYYGDNQIATVNDQSTAAAVLPVGQNPDFIGTYQ